MNCDLQGEKNGCSLTLGMVHKVEFVALQIIGDGCQVWLSILKIFNKTSYFAGTTMTGILECSRRCSVTLPMSRESKPVLP
jgi:hypothetical protein